MRAAKRGDLISASKQETRLSTTDRTVSGVSAPAAEEIRVTQLHWLLQAPLQGLLHNWIHFEEVLGSTWMRYGELHCALYSHHFSPSLHLSLSFPTSLSLSLRAAALWENSHSVKSPVKSIRHKAEQKWHHVSQKWAVIPHGFPWPNRREEMWDVYKMHKGQTLSNSVLWLKNWLLLYYEIKHEHCTVLSDWCKMWS